MDEINPPSEFWSVNMKNSFAYYCSEEEALSALGQLRRKEELIEFERLSGLMIYIPRDAIESVSQESRKSRALARAFEKMLKDEATEDGVFE